MSGTVDHTFICILTVVPFSLPKRYLGDPEKTAQTIDNDGWMHSGDIATFDEDEDPRIPAPRYCIAEYLFAVWTRQREIPNNSSIIMFLCHGRY